MGVYRRLSRESPVSDCQYAARTSVSGIPWLEHHLTVVLRTFGLLQPAIVAGNWALGGLSTAAHDARKQQRAISGVRASRFENITVWKAAGLRLTWSMKTQPRPCSQPHTKMTDGAGEVAIHLSRVTQDGKRHYGRKVTGNLLHILLCNLHPAGYQTLNCNTLR